MPPMSEHDTWNMFAAAALQGMLASPHLADHIKNVGSPPTTMDTYDYVAIAARAYADALLAESKKRERPEPASDGRVEAALREARTDLMIVANNARDAAKTEHRWSGVAEKLMERVAACDAALSAEPTPPQPDDDGWVDWDGSAHSEDWPTGEGAHCPPEVRHKLIDVRFRDGKEMSCVPAGSDLNGTRDTRGAFWRHEDMDNDIVAYRIVSEAGVTK